MWIMVPKTKEDVISNINSCCDMEYNWDGYQSLAPSAFVGEQLINIINRMDNDIIIPCVCPCSGGGIQLEWHNYSIFPYKELEVELPNELDKVIFLKVIISKNENEYPDIMEEGEIELKNIDKIMEVIDWIKN